MSAAAESEPLAEAVAEKVNLSAEAREMLRKEQSAIEYIKLLVSRQKNSDALHMLANLLPRREAVWWAAQAARQTAGENPLPEIEAAIKATERWVTELSDESRRACWAVSNKAGPATAAGSAAMGAYFSGGSLGPPDGDHIPPDETITPNMVATSVLISAMSGDAKNMKELFQKFVDQGIDLYGQLRK